MRMKKRCIAFILSFIMLGSLSGCNNSKVENKEVKVTHQKNISRIERFNLPKDYKYIDYKGKAIGYDELVFDISKEGDYFPLIWEDKTFNTFGIPAYVGDGRMHNDGSEEAVTTIAATLSATLVGIDKSDYVSTLGAYYSESEKIILNNPSGNSKNTSMWYLLYPAILFTQVSIHYPEQTKIREYALNNIESWYKAAEIMINQNSFDFTGFDFIANEPYRNEIWTEPDSAIGIAMLMYYGYELTQDEKYLNSAIKSIECLSSYYGSPMYEALLYFAPYLSSMFNLKLNTSFDTEKFINDIFNGNSIPRGGWGAISGVWGDYSVNGLMGSITDGGGYAFAMNTFTAAYAISPVAKYDARYASSLGKWYLNLVSNSRYFFVDETNKENQSSTYSEKSKIFGENTAVIPFEGIRKSYNSKTPWFGGDPTVYGWAETDFSLYSGSHIGIFASIIEKTNIDKILKIDLNKADLFNQEYPAYLIYNPYTESKTIKYNVINQNSVDLFNGATLFDSVTNKVIAKNVYNDCDITIGAGEAVVITELKAGFDITHDGLEYKTSDKIISTDHMTIMVTNYKNNDTVNGEFKLVVDYISTLENDKVKEIIVDVKDKTYSFNNLKDIKFKVSELGSGSTTFNIKVVMESGLMDKTDIRLLLQ